MQINVECNIVIAIMSVFQSQSYTLVLCLKGWR